MKINLSLVDTKSFEIKEKLIGGETCYLIYPKKNKDGLNIKWNNINKIFRSSIWTAAGDPVSLLFKKFTNLGERPEFEPLNENDNLNYVTKHDGSLIGISTFKGERILRVRNRFDAGNIPCEEQNILALKYPKLFNYENDKVTILLEYESPSWVIIEKRVVEPTLTLIGVVNHDNYSYWTQDELDNLALELEIERPQIFHFKNLQEAVKNIVPWMKGEGVVVSSSCGQILKKIKSDRYLALHKIKSNLNTAKSILEFWFSVDCPRTEESFLDLVDFELKDYFKPFVKKIVEANKEFNSAVEWVRKNLAKQPEERKARALWLNTLPSLKQSLGFAILSGQECKIHKIKFQYILNDINKN